MTTQIDDFLKQNGEEFGCETDARGHNSRNIGGVHTDGDPIGTIGTIGNTVSGIWDAPDLSLLAGPAIPPPVFPIEVLGPYWSEWCKAAARGANAPVDYTGIALLAVGAALIGNTRRVAVTPSWQEPAILWSVLIGVPSSGKSPALDPFSEILSALDADMAFNFEKELQDHAANLELASQKKEIWKAEIKKALTVGKALPDLPTDAHEPPPPQRPRIVISDTTMEAAADIAAANPRGLILLRDELGGWWRGFNRYGGDGERQFWLQSHGARPYTVDRKKLGRPVIIPSLSISVLGGTQPDVLAQLVDGEEDGFASRFLYCFPEVVSGFTLSRCPADLNSARIALKRLHALPIVGDCQSQPQAFICDITSDTASTFEHWCRERRKDANLHFGLFGTWLGKTGGLALRIALVLEHLRWCATPSANSANSANSFPTQVGLDALLSAIRLVDDWATPMARRAFGTASISHEEADAASLARWLERNQIHRFNSRELRRSSGGPSGRLSKAKQMEDACNRLEEAGIIRFAGTRGDGKPGRTRRDYEVNPALLAGLDSPTEA
jgi:hypothetical protein